VPDEAERLGDILDRAVVKPARRRRSVIARVRRRWAAVVGAEEAAHSCPRSVRRGVLTVEVDSSGLLAELAGYRRVELMRGLAEGPDAVGVREIRFVLAKEAE
jgi:predicted nucleic acid-binding Zn ribbon protein